MSYKGHHLADSLLYDLIDHEIDKIAAQYFAFAILLRHDTLEKLFLSFLTPISPAFSEFQQCLDLGAGHTHQT